MPIRETGPQVAGDEVVRVCAEERAMWPMKTAGAIDLRPGAWKGQQSTERHFWAPHTSDKQRLGGCVCEGSANSHFQEGVLLMKSSSVPRTREEDKEEVPGAHRPPRWVCLSNPPHSRQARSSWVHPAPDRQSATSLSLGVGPPEKRVAGPDDLSPC